MRKRVKDYVFVVLGDDSAQFLFEFVTVNIEGLWKSGEKSITIVD